MEMETFANADIQHGIKQGQMDMVEENDGSIFDQEGLQPGTSDSVIRNGSTPMDTPM